MNFNPTYTIPGEKNLNHKLYKNIVINKDLYKEINDLKNQIDNIEHDKWRLIRTIMTDYEFVGNNKFHNIKQLKERKTISRAYYKLWEILSHYESDFKLKSTNSPMKFAGLAEAPGGFIQCLVDYRQNKEDQLTGISLKDSEDNKIDWLVENNNVKLIYGDESKKHDGNLYNPEIIKAYCNHYKKQRADFVTADGGFLLNTTEENHKGQHHNNLFLCETYIAMNILKNGGHFVIKIYDICNKMMIDILTILNSVFKKVHVMKPVTSREMNNENYIICIDYKRNNKTLKSMFKVIQHLWNNDNKLIINRLFQSNDKRLINLFSNISKQKMLYQKRKLEKAISLQHTEKDTLIQMIRNNHKMKSKKAYNWIEKHF